MTDKQQLVIDIFKSDLYQMHNEKRIEHFNSLNIDISGKTILETGAGIGDHTVNLIDRGAIVTVSEPRKENLEYLKQRFQDIEISDLDLDNTKDYFKDRKFDCIYCYGTLYHLDHPDSAIKFMAEHTNDIIFLETCVSYGSDLSINNIKENPDNPSFSIYGGGCRPTRNWIFQELKKYFEFVYIPKTQANHQEFPIDWNNEDKEQLLKRAIFVASRKELENDKLSDVLLDQQERFDNA